MMRQRWLGWWLFLGCVSACQQSAPQHFYGDEGLVVLETNETRAVVYFTDTTAKAQALSYGTQGLGFEGEGLTLVDPGPEAAHVLITGEQAISDAQLRRLSDAWGESTRSVSRGYRIEDLELWLTHDVLVSLAAGVSERQFLDTFSTSGLTVVAHAAGWLKVAVPEIDAVLSLANRMHESPLTQWAHPDFRVTVERSSDPLFGEQYYLHNEGQIVDGIAVTSGFDINASEAWALNQGSSDITVAVIDDGIEDHPDLTDAAGNSRVLQGIGLPEAPGKSGGRPGDGGRHGVAVAGIIAASHNTVGVRGVAPNVKLLPIRLTFGPGGSTVSQMAEAFTYAVAQGADVISNSWNFQTCQAAFAALNQAIANAVTQGRAGKGAVVVFSSGNNYYSCVNYPGQLEGVISVGALDRSGARSVYSNHGADLEVMAFGGDLTFDIRTTDRVGAAGYETGDYTPNFAGTSAAAPQVTGVAALMLSANPNLTAAEVFETLVCSSRDLGEPGRDRGYGHGLVDAFAAVQAVVTNTLPRCANDFDKFRVDAANQAAVPRQVVRNYPHVETFDRFNACSAAYRGKFGDNDCDMYAGGWFNIKQGDTDEWALWQGMVSGGPQGDRLACGNYLKNTGGYVSNWPDGQQAIVYSPAFDLSSLQSPQLSFWYRLHTDESQRVGNTTRQMGDLRLELSEDGGASWGNVFSIGGNQAPAWEQATVDLAAYQGKQVRFRFVGEPKPFGTLAFDHVTVDGTTSCATPSNLQSTLTGTTAQLTWSATGGSTVVRYREAGRRSWTVVPDLTGNGHLLTALTPGNDYEWTVQAQCGTQPSLLAPPQSFAIAGVRPGASCEPSVALNENTCVFDAKRSLNSGVTEIELQSQGKGTWPVHVAKAGTYDLALDYTYPSAGAAPSVTLEVNNTVRTLSLPATRTNTLQTQVALEAGRNTVSLSMVSGKALKVRGLRFLGCGTASFCSTPLKLDAVSVGYDQVNLRWNAYDPAQSYDVRYREAGASGWTTLSGVDSASRRLVGLKEGTAYTWAARVQCPGATSAYGSGAFTTRGVFCDAPDAVTVQAEAYDEAVGVLGSGTWQNPPHIYLDSGFDFVEWRSVQVPSAGSYRLRVYYSSTGTLTRRVDLRVNGGPPVVLDFPQMEGYASFEFIEVPVTLGSGANTLRLERGSHDYAPNRLDFLHIADCPLLPAGG